MNWDDLRIVLAIEEKKTILLAAEKLGIHKTTVLRRINVLEKQLGIRLFDRLSQGYVPTEASEKVFQLAYQMEDGVNEMERQIIGKDTKLTGEIKLGISQAMATPFWMTIFKSLMDKYPELELELLITDDLNDLNKREADIVIRATNNPPENLIGRKLALYHVAAYASPEYLKTHDITKQPSECHWIGWNDYSSFPEWVLRSQYPHIPVRGRINNHIGQVSAAIAGLGIAMLGCTSGDSEPLLRRVPPGIPEPRKDIWVLTHKDLLATTRVRVLMNLITESISEIKELIEGKCPIQN